MANKLLEAYKSRLAISEKIYKDAHNNEPLSESKKIAIAVCLNNTNKFLNEQYSTSSATQRADLGNFKRFTLNLTTAALPNLIAFNLVLVYPMTSISGYVAYVKFVAGMDKGQTKQGDVFNDPFRLGDVNPNYTSAAVVENFTGDGSTTTFTVVWTPVTKVAKVTVNGAEKVNPTDYTVDGATITFTTAPAASAVIKVAYTYDNTIIPQEKLPTLTAKMESIPLIAKARRIAIFYSQLAAFQAKTDYGFNLEDQLAQKSVGQLKYEIDTEITSLLIENAEVDADLKFNKTIPYGISMAQHYESFNEVIEKAKQKIYDKTKRYFGTYVLIASNIVPVITFLKGFKAANVRTVNGPYLLGNLNGLDVYVTPAAPAGRYAIGVNDGDAASSAAVYAPYMPIIPTQLLGHADGSMSQGWSTMYALELLNKDLLIAGEMVEEARVVVTDPQE